MHLLYQLDKTKLKIKSHYSRSYLNIGSDEDLVWFYVLERSSLSHVTLQTLGE
jgi:hypothetical protein